MLNRLKLHDLLVSILGSNHVYFQPPESIKMVYPAIVYNLYNIDNTFANNDLYISKKKYSLTLMDLDPDSPIIDKLISIPTCRFDRSYTKDNINHTTFIIYF